MTHITTFDWTTLTPDELAQKYLEFREAKADLEDRASQCKAYMDSIGNAMLAHMNATNTDSYRVKGVATVSKTSKTHYGCEDWAVFTGWLFNQAEQLKAQGQDPTQVFQYFQKRLSSTELKAYLEEHDTEQLPPAVTAFTEPTVSVRISK